MFLWCKTYGFVAVILFTCSLCSAVFYVLIGVFVLAYVDGSYNLLYSCGVCSWIRSLFL
jgi:hypothetical protein